jgi:hypothetical protein
MKTILIALLSFITLSLSAQSYRGSQQKQTAEEKLNDLYCTGLFHSTDGTILDVTSSISSRGYFNILEWLQGRVAGLQIQTSRSGILYPVIRGNVPGVYVDEMPVPINYLSFLNVNDIAIIKVIKTPFYGGFNGGGGAIAIYTIGTEEEDEIEETR